MKTLLPFGSLSLLVLLICPISIAQTSPYRGLWVGQARLDSVNEVTVGLDATNNPVAPISENPTPTADAAFLRLIIHVNGAGQAFLLKDVAVLNRAADAGDTDLLDAQTLLPRGDADFVLITDPELYDDVPPQPAIRIASATFDFGDARATDAVDALVETVAAAINTGIDTDTGNLNDAGDRSSLRVEQLQIGIDAAAPLIANADVARTFALFIETNFTSQVVDNIANGGYDASSHITVATTLQNQSFYGDSRMLDMVNAVMAAEAAATNHVEATVHNVAAAYADVEAKYSRFVSGSAFSDMIGAAAEAAVDAAYLSPSANETNILEAVNQNATVIEVDGQAFNTKIAAFADTRADLALDVVIEAIVAEVVAALPVNTNVPSASLISAADTAGRVALEEMVTRYGIAADVPSTDYNLFVSTEDDLADNDNWLEAAAVAAAGAVDAAISEKRNNGLYTPTSILNAARIGATESLRSIYGAAARSRRTELPLDGVFGSGDVRRQRDIGSSDSPLMATGVSGMIYLPANHPTNPFRHRRHPDHTTGFDIHRHIRLDFDAEPEGLARNGYGVERMTGVYREEIFGLHKPLGPQPDTAPVGLKVEGTFDLNRISLLDALNTF